MVEISRNDQHHHTLDLVIASPLHRLGKHEPVLFQHITKGSVKTFHMINPNGDLFVVVMI